MLFCVPTKHTRTPLFSDSEEGFGTRASIWLKATVSQHRDCTINELYIAHASSAVRAGGHCQRAPPPLVSRALVDSSRLVGTTRANGGKHHFGMASVLLPWFASMVLMIIDYSLFGLLSHICLFLCRLLFLCIALQTVGAFPQRAPLSLWVQLHSFSVLRISCALGGDKSLPELSSNARVCHATSWLQPCSMSLDSSSQVASTSRSSPH